MKITQIYTSDSKRCQLGAGSDRQGVEIESNRAAMQAQRTSLRM